MSRFLIVLIVILVVLAGALFFFAGRDTAKEPARVEKAVALENLTN
jgi:flagellar basal body-associated protein FliL